MSSYNELNHHGIQGQKWGKRRYQNPDGTLTPEGRIRYNSDGSKRKLDDKHKQDYKMHKAYNRARSKTEVYASSALAAATAGAAATVIGGPSAGIVAFLGGGFAGEGVGILATAGRNAVNNSKYKKMLLADQAGLAKSGKKWVDKIDTKASREDAAKKEISKALRTEFNRQHKLDTGEVNIFPDSSAYSDDFKLFALKDMNGAVPMHKDTLKLYENEYKSAYGISPLKDKL